MNAQTSAVERSPGALTNESVLKFVKAGMGDDVVTSMITSESGKFSPATDDLIALKQAGVSDRILSAVIGRSAGHLSNVLSTASTLPLLLHDGSPVRLRLNRNLTSAKANTGDTIDFEVLEDVKVDDVVVILRGAKAMGTVTDAEHKKRMARGGKLNVTLDYVRLVNDEKVALRAVRENKGGGHSGAMTGGIVATALIAWPAAPYSDGGVKLDRSRFVTTAGGTPVVHVTPR